VTQPSRNKDRDNVSGVIENRRQVTKYASTYNTLKFVGKPHPAVVTVSDDYYQLAAKKMDSKSGGEPMCVN
jgi:BioD-like phosphotransacetylase family protein